MIVPSVPQTAQAVAEHYDELDPFYRGIWGEHVHHGLWTSRRTTPEEAVEALIEHLARQIRLRPGERVCDVGCGYGATAEWLADRFGVHVTGLTLSRVQAQTASQRIAGRPEVAILCRDWLENPFADEAFDAVVAVESTEHMADKQKFFGEAHRTLRPEGRLAVCVWLAKTDPRAWETRHLLEPICREGRLAGMGSEADYRKWATEAGFVVEGFEDLSANVRRTWSVCARRLTRKLLADADYRHFLLDKHAQNRVFALTLVRIWAAYRVGAMRYGLLTARKPARVGR